MIERRTFLGMAAAAVPLTMHKQDAAARRATAVHVPADADRFGARMDLGLSQIDIKVSAQDTDERALVIENTNVARGGPARHLHTSQDGLFYVLAGEYRVEVGEERFTLTPGDSLLAPRQVPHVWAFAGDGHGRLLITFTPAGRMEAFFREVSKLGAMPPQDPALWRAHGMELLGPPLSI